MDRQFDRHEDHVIVPRGRKIAYGAGIIGQPLMSDVILTYAILFYNTILGVDAVLVGWALFIPRFWDAITDPLMGQISDNFRSRWGRRRPFILIGGLLCCLAFLLLWRVPADFSERAKICYLIAASILFYTFYTVATVPHYALGAELSTDYNERTSIYSYRTFCQRLGSLIAAPLWWLVFKFSSPQQGFAVITLFLSLMAAGGYVWTVLGTREEAEVQTRPKTSILSALRYTFENRPGVLLIASMFILVFAIMTVIPFISYVIIYYVYAGDKAAAGPLFAASQAMYITGVLLAIPLANWAGIKIGKRNALMVAMVFMCVGCISSWLFITPASPWLLLAFWAALIPANAGISIFPLSMLADVIDLDELRSDTRREGAYSSLFTFFWKLGITLGTLFLGYCLRWVGFDESLTQQDPQTLLNLRLILAIFPVVLAIVAVILLIAYPINKKQVEATRAILEERRRNRLHAVSES